MGVSDAEIEMRLAALRRQREALDREIADLVLYQELGRRLGAVRGGADGHDPDTGSDAGPVSAPAPARTCERDTTPPPCPAADRTIPPDPAPGAERTSDHGITPAGLPASRHSEARPMAATIPPAIAFTDDVAGARRYGRALVEAACAALARAGRPLHAAEILDVLSAQGFTLPGRDPVAALNTRLWKRSGPGGPLRRVGEATYALAADGVSA
ncbi:winged helix-turn-helix domain-containing protein [Methylobacterium sp. J-030]|uniref:winged helix-turn-helix domain-containing protein n=1 Tax=Methylobacterium sp. J-030 TaxID=2836627 RepID=UPI001FBB0065|nr:winged helix-turn-helix domain-containing protein [Methylobacterium sp. J-030]MCJ2073294.1 winged helix-turn-helix domain-containing protein [Methylobacterium sp. J-030]